MAVRELMIVLAVLVPLLILPPAYFIWLLTMYRRPRVRGRALVTEFTPPPGIGVAEAAFVMDGLMKPRTLAAMLIDLHLRGIVTIEGAEDGDITAFSMAGSAEGAERYEKVMIDALFVGAERVTAAEADGRFRAAESDFVGAVKTSLEEKGLLDRRPPFTRIIVMASAVIAAGAASLRIFPVFGLWGTLVPLIVYILLLELSYIAVSLRPRLTTKGKIALWRIHGFRRYLETAEAGRIRWQESESGSHALTPYAVAFGITLAWATKLQRFTDDLLDNIL